MSYGIVDSAIVALWREKKKPNFLQPKEEVLIIFLQTYFDAYLEKYVKQFDYALRQFDRTL